MTPKQIALAWVFEKTQAHKIHAEDSELSRLSGGESFNGDEVRRHINNEVEKMNQRAAEMLSNKGLLDEVKERAR